MYDLPSVIEDESSCSNSSFSTFTLSNFEWGPGPGVASRPSFVEKKWVPYGCLFRLNLCSCGPLFEFGSAGTSTGLGSIIAQVLTARGSTKNHDFIPNRRNSSRPTKPPTTSQTRFDSKHAQGSFDQPARIPTCISTTLAWSSGTNVPNEATQQRTQSAQKRQGRVPGANLPSGGAMNSLHPSL